jgi:hypothetical protein
MLCKNVFWFFATARNSTFSFRSDGNAKYTEVLHKHMCIYLLPTAIGPCSVAVLHKQRTIRKQYYISGTELI